MSAITNPLPKPVDNFSTQISSATISPTAITFTVEDATGLPTEGIGTLFKKDSDGQVVTGSVEFIHWTGVSSNTITLTDVNDRGLDGSDSGAQSYVAGDFFEVWVTSYYYQSQSDALLNEHDTGGEHDIPAMITNGSVLDEDDMVSDSDEHLATQQSIKAYVDTNAHPADGWLDLTGLSYASATTITTATDLTGVLQKGDKLKLAQSTGGTKYWPIIAITDSLITIPTTTDYTLENEAITSPQYSKIENPQGWPDLFSFTPTYSASGSMTFTSITTHYARFKIVGKLVWIYLSADGTTGGTASTRVQFTVPIDLGANDSVPVGIVDGSNRLALAFRESASLVGCIKHDAANWGLGAGRQLRVSMSYRMP
jgi:hypothetical protein